MAGPFRSYKHKRDRKHLDPIFYPPGALRLIFTQVGQRPAAAGRGPGRL